MKKIIVEVVVSVLLGLGILLAVLGMNGVLTTDMEAKEVTRFVCDAFFVSGVFLLCTGALSWCAEKGAFDGLSYSVKSLFNLHFSTKKYDWHEKESFADYKERKHNPDNPKSTKALRWVAIVGAVYTLGAIISLIIYETGAF